MSVKDSNLFNNPENKSGIEVFRKWLSKLENLATINSSMADNYASKKFRTLPILKYGKDTQILLRISNKLNDVALLIDNLGNRLFDKYHK